MRGLLIATLAVLLVCAGGCAREEDRARGEEEAEPGRPRVVALSPGIAMTLRDLGLGDLLVGRHGWDGWSEPALGRPLVVCGDQNGVDYEALAGVRPTHVLTQFGQGGTPGLLDRVAAREGWVLEDFRLLSLGDIERETARLWELLGDGDGSGGDRGSELVARMRGSWSVRAGVDAERVGRVLLVHLGEGGAGLGTWSVFGPGSFHQEILEGVGGKSAIEAGGVWVGAWMELGVEDVVALDAAKIIGFRALPAGSSGGCVRVVEGAGARRALGVLGIEAFAGVECAVVEGETVLLPGSGLVEVAEAIGVVLEGWSE